MELEDEIEEIPILFNTLLLEEPLSEERFKKDLSTGWRFLGNTKVRHSYSLHFHKPVWTIAGRIRLEGFAFSKSQQKLLRRGKAELRIEMAPKTVTLSDMELFDLHRTRFEDNPPRHLAQMVNYNPNIPQAGFVIRIYAEDVHVATSWYHMALGVADSTYCVYNPDAQYAKYSLGHLTLLLEIENVIASGAEYYYLGYRYSVRSHFDYKANFNNLERFKSWREWVPCARIPLSPRKT
jgi:leucyl-tRNA---protein transferase